MAGADDPGPYGRRTRTTRGPRYRGPALVIAAGVLLSGCTTTPEPEPAAPPSPLAAEVSAPAAATTVLAVEDPTALAVATSAVLFASAPVAVLVAADDPVAQAGAAPIAERVGAPLLLTPPTEDSASTPGVAAELERLGVGTVLVVGDGAAGWAGGSIGTARDDGAGPAVVTQEAGLPAVTVPQRRPPVLVLTSDRADPATQDPATQDPATRDPATRGRPTQLAAVTTARASGAEVHAVPGGDPRTDPGPLPVPRPEKVLALGSAFGDAELLARRITVATDGAQLPGGGQVLFPGRRMVALYGHPGTAALGVLGEQGVAGSVQRAQALAAEYQPLVDEPVVPAFELITTVAAAEPGPDGDYSSEAAVQTLRPWVDAAREAGVYVLLDLQPGRADFLTQAKRYEELLAEPHVGLALDPEWRLRPDQVHRRQIGSVGVDELNGVLTWLADLTRDRVLPQKLLMVHQFRLSMIAGRERLDTSRDELAVVLHADGFGPPDLKLETWNAMHQGEPPGVYWGWKNFLDEDTPTFTPAQTVAVGPTPPVLISYQ